MRNLFESSQMSSFGVQAETEAERIKNLEETGCPFRHCKGTSPNHRECNPYKEPYEYH